MIDTKALRELCARANRHSNYRDEAYSKLISALRNAAPELLDEIDALRERLRVAEEVVEAARRFADLFTWAGSDGRTNHLTLGQLSRLTSGELTGADFQTLTRALSAFDASEGKK